EVTENRIALGPAQEPGPAQGLHTADRSPATQLGQEPVALDGEVGVAKVKGRQRIEAGRHRALQSRRHDFPSTFELLLVQELSLCDLVERQPQPWPPEMPRQHY